MTPSLQEVALTFDAEKHRYFLGNAEIPSVTAVTGIISKGDGLLQWAVNCALGAVKEAMRPGKSLDEVQIDRLLNDARFAHRRTVGDAANVGKIVHAWVEARIKAILGLGKAKARPVNEAANVGIESFLAWEEAHSVDYVGSERRVCSREHLYAGTLDILARVNGELAIVDIKTSKSVYPEYHLQTAAYQAAYEEEAGEKVAKRLILHLDKATGKPKEIPADGEGDLPAFLAARQLYRRLRGK